MKKLNKFMIGAALWVPSSYVFAYWAHIAPEGAYNDLGSSIEFISCLFMFAFFIGIPSVTAAWMFKK